jgi:hypothetical protein
MNGSFSIPAAVQQQASHLAPHSISHAAQKLSTPDHITITQQLQDNNQNHIRNHAHDACRTLSIIAILIVIS